MRIVLDENIPLGTEFFSDFGELIRLPGRKITAEDVKDADLLIIRSVTKVDASLLEDSKVRFVGTCTIGIDHLDLEYLESRGIQWANAPGCNANSVVQYVYAALAALDMNWLNLSIGIIGCGNVGGLLYKQLKAQGVKLCCFDPNLHKEQIPDLTSLEAVLACDVISIHAPLVLDGPFPSFHLLKEVELMKLKHGAVLLNAGRGAVISNEDLLKVLTIRKDLRVVLDVWESEPDIDISILDKLVIGTPHIAGYSYDGKLNGTEIVYNAASRFLNQIPSKRLTDLAHPLANNSLDAGHLNDPWVVTKHVILQAYNIDADSARLRETAHESVAKNIPVHDGFDLLRKHYPKRHEFHNYRVIYHHASQETKDWLCMLGFQCE